MATSSLAGASNASASVIAVTTTFTPAPTCQSPYLTMLSSPGYEIWFAEPVPVPATTASACYPSDWIQHYTSTGSSSIAPVVSPLTCPQGWESVEGWNSSYFACCPSSYGLHTPTVIVDSSRPAYGGTCFSDLTSGQTITVTAYDTASVIATSIWTATTTTEQVYAHPIDGYHATQSLSQTVTAVTTSTISPSPSPHPNLSGGAIAGIVISVLGAALLGVGATLLFRRRKKASNNGRIESLPNAQIPPYSDIADNAPDMLKVQHERASVAELPSDQQIHEMAELPENLNYTTNRDNGHGSTQV